MLTQVKKANHETTDAKSEIHLIKSNKLQANKHLLLASLGISYYAENVIYAYLTRESPVGQHSLFLKNRDAQLLQRVAWESYLANRSWRSEVMRGADLYASRIFITLPVQAETRKASSEHRVTKPFTPDAVAACSPFNTGVAPTKELSNGLKIEL